MFYHVHAVGIVIGVAVGGRVRGVKSSGDVGDTGDRHNYQAARRHCLVPCIAPVSFALAPIVIGTRSDGGHPSVGTVFPVWGCVHRGGQVISNDAAVN